jgi:nicotinic acid mononucleotide adenylyltransferase
VRKVFASLDSLPYLGEAERRDFAYYRTLFEDQFQRITKKAREGRLRPLDLRGFPQDLRYPGYSARIGVFIGSFDPFQMTHLAMALRFLASDASEADAVFVVPEGSPDPSKPRKTEYRFRYEILRRQLAGILEPLVVPLDLGEGADTIEVVRRLIALHRGSAMRLTHLMGADSLPTAVRLLPADLEAWNAAAAQYGVILDFSLFVVRRDRSSVLKPLMQKVRSLGVPIVVDRNVIGTPSSTVFRADRAITLVFPTDAVLGSLELLFRYGMNQPWSSPQAPPNAWWSDHEI